MIPLLITPHPSPHYATPFSSLFPTLLLIVSHPSPDYAPPFTLIMPPSGFYTATGAFTVAGIHALPPYLYFWKYRPNSWTFLTKIRVLLVIPIVVLGVARLLGLAVEV